MTITEEKLKPLTYRGAMEILWLVSRADDMTYTKLCRLTDIPNRTILYTIDKLEDTGFLYRDVNPDKRCEKILRNTKKGEIVARMVLELICGKVKG